jgi:hypothetical protein
MSGVQALVFEIVADESNRVCEHDAHVLAGVPPAPGLRESPIEARIFDPEEIDSGSDLRFRYEEGPFTRADLELERSLVPEECCARGGLFDVLELESQDVGKNGASSPRLAPPRHELNSSRLRSPLGS